ncbi:HoxN/HupN/NixA family nickel/cobalt transporter [Thermanaerosceptrum fracticalcis]|uniref:Nickel/cobalt efflux system n=1 Tax=Thermanaerosceptrum fracticalcis TaxID=1712410 RepID=A0A7G6E3W7_THEFR|nr:HoxN/HupN/NixA family nickel/cobalt transporter [Thermanaerosceptrum fracticalcis]QNB46771.1 HoxN/HupN/NixA family nickel/cobalt transporter [Thermanaerosceptrum fracticalcis]
MKATSLEGTGKKSTFLPSWFGYGLVVAGIHILGLTLLLWQGREYPELLGMGFLAYTLGLRHAFDADHIAAIDNIVRKLVQQKKDATGIGFYFSLGHSTVVFLMTLVTILAMRWSQQNLPQLQEIGGLIGTTVSGGFLLIIGFVNLYIWLDIYRLFLQAGQKKYDDRQLEQLLDARGFIARFAGSFYRFINKSWHIYPLGFLFGLGFDTASEVALIAISAGVASQTIPIAGILSFPILFAAGMSLMDTADGIFMITAYRWAFATPLRKIYYNLTVTGLSVIAALFIGGIEIAQVITPKLGLQGWFWTSVQGLEFSGMGYLLVALFVFVWAFSYGAWKLFNLEKR